MDHSADKKGQDKALNAQRERVAQLLDAQMVYRIKGVVQSGGLMLRSDLDISRNVFAQKDVLEVLRAFNPDYLRLVLEAVLDIPIKPTDELSFMKHLETVALKQIFRSPKVMQTKKYIYTTGNWLTDEGKKAIARHFLFVMCQILYLMEKCLQARVIPDSERMFKPNSRFKSINDIFGFISRNLISGKTLLPKVMKNIGFEPTYHWSGEDENNQSGRSTLPRRSFLLNNRKKIHEELAIKNDKLTQKIDKLTAEVADLKAQLRTVEDERDYLQIKATFASKNEEKWMKNWTSETEELAEEYSNHSDNWDRLMGELQSFGSKEVDSPVDLKEKTEEETNQSDSTLTDSSNEKQD